MAWRHPPIDRGGLTALNRGELEDAARIGVVLAVVNLVLLAVLFLVLRAGR